jgi:hypothetical protein
MCPTPLGRVQTRAFVLIGPALLGALLSLLTANEGFVVLIGIYLLLGVVLDVLFYPYVIRWQPPWLTGVLGLGEFVLLYVVAQAAEVGLEPLAAIVFYWVSWALAIGAKIVVLPNVYLTWIENGGEFRDVGWSIPAQNEPLPPIAAVPADAAAAVPPLAREFSSVNPVPAELRDLPAPSGVHRVPEEIRRLS